MGGAHSNVEEMRSACSILVGKPDGKRQHGIPKCRWEDIIRMDLREIGLESVDWLHLAQNRNYWQALVNMIMNLQAP